MRLDLGPAIEDVRRKALDAIDDACARAWERHEADRVGKNTVRAAKLDEAQRLLRGIPKTPWLDMEADVRGITRLQMARMVCDAAAEGDATMQAIERVRMTGKTAVRTAATVAAIRSARIDAETQADNL